MIKEGTVIDNKYSLICKIGEGGMGEVWRAKNNSAEASDSRDVAIKFLNLSLCEKQRSRLRFEREMQAAYAAGYEDESDNIKSLSCPGIVKVYDRGEAENRPFIVMELLSGLSLRRYAEIKEPSIIKLLNLVIQICEALEHAHGRGIIHRDLKPDNILVCENGQNQEQIKILDFGLARLLNEPDQIMLTRPGTALGTCSYMSPEQAKGEPADERSDLYSLGIILYEIFCGKVPFKAAEAPSVLYMQVHEKPKAPRKIKPEIPEYIEKMILKLMDKDPRQRFQNAAELKNHIFSLIQKNTGSSVIPSALNTNLSNTSPTETDNTIENLVPAQDDSQDYNFIDHSDLFSPFGFPNPDKHNSLSEIICQSESRNQYPLSQKNWYILENNVHVYSKQSFNENPYIAVLIILLRLADPKLTFFCRSIRNSSDSRESDLLHQKLNSQSNEIDVASRAKDLMIKVRKDLTNRIKEAYEVHGGTDLCIESPDNLRDDLHRIAFFDRYALIRALKTVQTIRSFIADSNNENYRQFIIKSVVYMDKNARTSLYEELSTELQEQIKTAKRMVYMNSYKLQNPAADPKENEKILKSSIALVGISNPKLDEGVLDEDLKEAADRNFSLEPLADQMTIPHCNKPAALYLITESGS